MKNVLLLISQERDKEAALNRGLDVAKTTGAKLNAIYVMDERFNRKYESMLSESTFVADKPGEDMCRALREEYHARADKMLHALKVRCESLNIECTTHLRSGDYYEVARDLCQELKPEVVVVSERKNSFLTRMIGFSDRVRLGKMIGVPIEAF